jgi:hypothetical protein
MSASVPLSEKLRQLDASAEEVGAPTLTRERALQQTLADILIRDGLHHPTPAVVPPAETEKQTPVQNKRLEIKDKLKKSMTRQIWSMWLLTALDIPGIVRGIYLHHFSQSFFLATSYGFTMLAIRAFKKSTHKTIERVDQKLRRRRDRGMSESEDG